MKLFYFDHEFSFKILERSSGYFVCQLILTGKDERFYSELSEREDESFWYLDAEGERLDDNELFDASPWSLIEGSTTTKLLSRIRDENHVITFSTIDSYGGNLVRILFPK